MRRAYLLRAFVPKRECSLGATSFDNIGGALLLIFQVQTLSTWFEMDYFTSMTSGWYSTWFYQLIIFLVGFIVSQLFVAIICFGYENLEARSNQPKFDNAVNADRTNTGCDSSCRY